MRLAFVLSGLRACPIGSRSSLCRSRATHHARQTQRVAPLRMVATNPVPVTTNPESKVQINSSTTAVDSFVGDLLVLGFPEQKDVETYKLSRAVTALDMKLGGAIGEIIEENKFSGKAGSKFTARLIGKTSCKRIACYGLGENTEKQKTLRDLGSFAVATAKSMKGVQTVGVHIADMSGIQAQCIAEGATVAAFTDLRFKKAPEDPNRTPQLELLSQDAGAAIRTGKALSSGVLLAKELVDAPANFVTPSTLAETALSIANESGMSIKVLEKDQCEELGMGSFLAVSRASAQPPKFIHMSYKPNWPKKKVVIIGKGLTFDAGGYNLKAGPGSSIEKMKLDMGGAAATLGAAKVIGQLKPENVEVHFIIASCENMISGDGMRPGDIITASNGTTIEVLNTDAEGRLTLADALVYAENLGEVDYIIDLATLTGAIVVSLGNDVAGMWSSSDELASMLTTASESTGEKMWRMPLVEEYKEAIKGSISDLKNIGGKGAGSITAALFLQEFVKSTPWAHLDIAGTAYTDKAGGGTGYGVRTLAELVKNLSK